MKRNPLPADPRAPEPGPHGVRVTVRREGSVFRSLLFGGVPDVRAVVVQPAGGVGPLRVWEGVEVGAALGARGEVVAGEVFG